MEKSQWILLDSNAYFRLARSINPLLKTPIYKNGPTLIVIPQLDEEYQKGDQRLRSKFFWVTHPCYCENRQDCFKVTREQANEIETTYLYIRETSKDLKLGASKVDIRVLAYSYVLKISVVTDDIEMISLAKEYDISICKTLDLLKLLVENKFIGIEKVEEIVQYWAYQCDYPHNFKSDYKKLFNRNLP